MKKKITPKSSDEDKLNLQLYVAGMSPKSMQAIENLKRLCDEHLENVFELDIIDIYKNPEAEIEQHIVFSPSLIKQSPLPKKTLIGVLSDTEKMIKTLGINSKNDHG